MAPTPLAANSFDDNGVLVRNRTDVAVCEGFPLALDLWASDGNAGDKVRLPFRAFESLAHIVITSGSGTVASDFRAFESLAHIVITESITSSVRIRHYRSTFSSTYSNNSTFSSTYSNSL